MNWWLEKATEKNLSVENAVVAFVKGANERSEFFGKKKNKTALIHDEQVRTNKY